MLGYLGTSNELGDKNVEFPFVSFDNIVAATENFSDCHMLGRGGFGKVYKVMTHLRVIVTWQYALKRIAKAEERLGFPLFSNSEGCNHAGNVERWQGSCCQKA